MKEIKFLKGSLDNYKNLSNKDNDSIYFAEETPNKTEIHLGESSWSSDEIVFDKIDTEANRATSAETAITLTVRQHEKVIASGLVDINNRLNSLTIILTSLEETVQKLLKIVPNNEKVIASALVDLNYKATNTIDVVDLDLPSGKLWMKCNLGAKTETDYGLFFQWGATEGYADGSHSWWSTAPFNNGSDDYDEEYFASASGTVCPNGILSKEYDAVYVNTHGKAYMPTHEDFQELYNNTNNEWITDFNGSGVAGRKFTSKVDSSKYIFFPAAGRSDGESWFDVGSYGYVWSSSLYSSRPYRAFNLYFDSGGVLPSNYYNRYRGFSVRGVLCK